MNRHSEPSFTGSLKSEQRSNFYEHNKPIAVLMILILFLFPIVGVFVIGVSGAVLGVVISVLGYYLTPYVVLKLREGWGRV
jgi:uncharacterized membrane protein SpoIIM required for sporulation